MSKKSKLIDNRVNSSSKVCRAVTTHTGGAAKALSEVAIRVDGPNTQATEAVFQTVFAFLANVLAFHAKEIDDAELAVVGERADDVAARDTRDTEEAAMRTAMVRIRSNMQHALGPKGLSTYGLEGAVPAGSYELASFGEKVVRLLNQTPFNVVIDGVTYDGAGMAQALDTKVKAFRQALVVMEREAQELVGELGKRDAKVEAWADGYQGVADAATGLYRLAGLKHLADRVRPSSRTLSGEEEAQDIDPAPPAGLPAPEAG